MLLENRVKKLKKDEEQLLKQINAANKKSQYADAVIERKMKEIMDRHQFIQTQE